MICRFCASIVAVGVGVCPQCGAPQPRQPDPPPAAQPPKPTRQETRQASQTNWQPPWQQAPAQASAAMYYDAHRGVLWMPAPPPFVKPRSYRWKVCFVLVLYTVFFFPGLAANIVWWNEARQIQARTGIAPAGKGCLTILLVMAGTFLALSVIFVALAA